MVVTPFQSASRLSLRTPTTLHLTRHECESLGLGVHCLNLTANGHWTPPEAALHISVLELLAVFKALRASERLLLNKVVQVTRQHCHILPQQTGWDPLSSTASSHCSNLRLVLCAPHFPGSSTCSISRQCVSRSTQQVSGSVSRMAVRPSGLLFHLPEMGYPMSGPVCICCQCQV